MRGKPEGAAWLRMVESVVLIAALALSLFSVLGRTDPRLDASWQEMLIYAHAHGLQFGRDVIFTWGPWGFLCSLTHLGSTEAVPILIWQVAGQIMIAAALVTLVRSLVLWRRIAFVAALLAFHWVFQDTVYFVLIALITVSALMRPDARIARLVAWTLVLGFLAQIKFTYFVISTAGVISAMVCWVTRGSWRRAWGLAFGFGFAVVASWIAAGQGLDNLYPYIRRSLEISAGYADAMGFDESWTLFLWGSALAILCAAFIWRAWRTLPDGGLALGASGFLAFFLFVIWKESFIRADMVPLGGHVFGLFTTVLVLAPALPGLLFPGRRWHWFDGSIILCLIGIACFDPQYYTQAPRVAWQIIGGNLWSLRHLGALPGAWQHSFEEACADASLPRIRAAVGAGTVDVYDYSIGVALLNGLKLSPRPIFQSYSAYTPSLEGWNLRFYESDRAPDFLLWKEERVDDRYPGQDDALLLAGLPGHYEPLFEEGGYWLFRKLTPVSRGAVERPIVMSRKVLLSEDIELPSAPSEALWIEATAVPNALGLARGVLYKPAVINIAVTDDLGRKSVWRLLPRVARGGFILDPMLRDGGDMALLMAGKARNWVREFHFEAPEGQGEFWSRVEVSVFRLPALPVRLEGKAR